MGYKIFKEEQKRKVLGVLFDMDGLLLDTERLYVENFMIASKEAGFPMSFKETLGLRSLNIEERQRYLEAIKGPKIKDEPIRLRMDYLTDKAIKDHGAKPKLGAKELLDYLEEQNIPCAIVSSSAKERIINNLKPNGFLNKFQALCSGNEVEKGKPYPDIYLFGAKKIGINPENCLALEDSKAGIFSASRAKTMSIVIPDLDEQDLETKANAFGYANSLLDIINLIKELNGDKNV